jgi:hypothetical protein
MIVTGADVERYGIPRCGERGCKLVAHRRAADNPAHAVAHYMTIPAAQPVPRGYDAWGLLVYALTVGAFAGLIVAAILR